MTSSTVIPNLRAFIAACRDGAALVDSESHGDRHWRSVARAGLAIVRADSAPDPVVLFLFAALHDCRRDSEHSDPEHGPRAAAVAANQRTQGMFLITDAQFTQLDEACRLHDTGAVSDDPTIGACYDADRLNLTRFGFTLDPALLSRPISRDADFIERCRPFAADPGSWQELAAGLLTSA